MELPPQKYIADIVSALEKHAEATTYTDAFRFAAETIWYQGQLVEDEREGCAKIARHEAETAKAYGWIDAERTAHNIEVLIRGRKQK